VPAISEGIVEHYAEDYAGVLELAETNSTYAVRDTDALQYFAIDAWAYDIANPGVGCTGELEEVVSSATAAAATPTATPAATTAAAAAAVSRP
jgi:hypothetical protein